GRRFLSSSALFCRPATAISHPTPSVAAATVARCGSKVIELLVTRELYRSNLPASVRVRLEVQLAPAAIGYVRVELGGGQIGVSEHFLNRPEIGPSLAEMRRRGVPE